VPAFLMAILFFAYVVARASMRPQDAPAEEVAKLTPRERWMPFVIYVLPLSGILIVVVGSLLGGFATPTEAAALGVISSFLAAACYRRLSWKAVWETFQGTAKTSTMILFIIMASTTFSQILAFSGATSGMVSLITSAGADPLMVLLAMVVILLVMGCFMDQVSMVMITVPIFIPVAHALGIDLIWLGVIYLITMEMGFLTPPFGLLIFVIKAIAPPSISLMTVYRAAVPFLIIELFVLGLIIAFPTIALWLPALMR